MGKSKKELVSLKKKANSYNPIQIKEGELLLDRACKKWKVGKAVGAGGFGEIYLVSDDILKTGSQDALYIAKIEPHKSGPLFVEMNFYIRVAKKEMIDQWKKDKGLKHLGMPHYITFGSHFYQNEKYRFLILKRFGQDLGKILHRCKKKFHIKTVFTLGIQILDILEYIHSHGYIHADIKDSNLLLGTGKNDDNIYLLDYGLACKYIDSLGVHKEYNPDQRKAHDGTLQYTSRDAHVGAHSRRSDLEVLAYNMIHWLCGFLPWEGELSDPEKVAEEKQNYMSNIPSFLKKCFGDDPPVVISHFLKYVNSLNFKSKPDYEYCKTLLRQGIRQHGYADDGKLNFNSAPAKLKSRKRIRDSDTENLVELKPVKAPRNASRQPCVPVQANFNRMTRQQTAANSPALRSREVFDWVKVLQSNPEKILKSHSIPNDQLKKKRVIGKQEKQRPKCEEVEENFKKDKANPLDNPTPAILEVLKLRTSSPTFNAGKRMRSESYSCSPIFYENSSLTPAMEEVIRRREMQMQRNQEKEVEISTSLSSSTRSTRLKTRNKNNAEKNSQSSECKRITRKTALSEKLSIETTRLRRKTRTYSLSEHKLVSDVSLSPTKKKSNGKNISNSQKTSIRKCRKGLPTLPKSPNKKSLAFAKKKKIKLQEVIQSENNLALRLRSRRDKLSEYYFNKTANFTNLKIRNYAANSSVTKRRRKCGINCNSLAPATRDSSIIL